MNFSRHLCIKPKELHWVCCEQIQSARFARIRSDGVRWKKDGVSRTRHWWRSEKWHCHVHICYSSSCFTFFFEWIKAVLLEMLKKRVLILFSASSCCWRKSMNLDGIFEYYFKRHAVSLCLLRRRSKIGFKFLVKCAFTLTHAPAGFSKLEVFEIVERRWGGTVRNAIRCLLCRHPSK